MQTPTVRDILVTSRPEIARSVKILPNYILDIKMAGRNLHGLSKKIMIYHGSFDTNKKGMQEEEEK